MNRVLTFCNVFCLSLITLLPPTAFADDLFIQKLDSLVYQWAAKPEVPSVLLRIEKSDALVYSGSAGKVSFHINQDVSPESHFRSASVGKLFTAATVLRLMEKEILSIDDSISKYLPGKLIDSLFTYKKQAYGESITIRQLLSHTSGLANIDNDPTKNAWICIKNESVRLSGIAKLKVA